jgi:membrane fusion protein, heavy metal efflux system
MLRRLLIIIISVAIVGGLGAVGVWVWLQSQQERQRETQRELSVKPAAKRVVDPKTGQVLIHFTAEDQERLGLIVVPVESVKRQPQSTLLGFSTRVPQRVAEVRSPWTGVLQAPPEGMPAVGRQVRKGQSLGTLVVQWAPSDRIQLEGQLRDVKGLIGETEAQLKVKRAAVQRLGKIGEAVPEKQRLETEGELAMLDARLTAAQAKEKALREALQQKESEIRFAFTVPAAGQLTELLRRGGEVVSAGDLMATVYDPRELWVTAQVPPGQLPADVNPAEAQIIFRGFESAPLAGRLVRINTEVDRQQQARELVYGAASPKGLIPVGLQAEVRVARGPATEMLAVPRSAVLQRNEDRLVYIVQAPEHFAKQVVEVLDVDADRFYLRPTLPAGARVVRQGAQCLLSEEFKESIQLVEEGSGADKDEADKTKDEK